MNQSITEYAAYQDPTLPAGERVRDLLERMTLEEKAAQIASPFGTVVDVHSPPETGWGSVTAGLSALGLPPREAAAKGNELQRKHVEQTRLGIPVLLSEEALVGLKVQDATTYPDAIAQASTWDPELIEEMGRAIGGQMAAMGVRQALSPLADVARDPRWGRVDETYGEDPLLVGSMASAFVRGLQNADPAVPLIATLKHFIGYPASDGGRNGEPVQMGPRELHEVHGRAFEMAIRLGGALGVMPSYNDIDGDPVTGSRKYLTDLLRLEYGFDGLVISDLGAVVQLQSKHGTSATVLDAYAQALQAGVDLDLDNRVSSDRIIEAVNAGVLKEADLDRAVASVLRAKFRLGLFERPYADLDAVPETLDSAETRALARTIAEKSVTLLKNDPDSTGTRLLPLDPALGTIAVIGPNADRPMGQLGHYSYQVLDSITQQFAQAADPEARLDQVEEFQGRRGADDAQLLVETVPLVSFLDGIRSRVSPETSVLHEPGCTIEREDRSGIAAAVSAAEQAEVAVVVVGDQAGINGFGSVGEGLDSTTLQLPGVQRELVEAVVATGTPTVVVLSHGRPFVLDWMAESVPAIVTTWFGGEEAGTAAAAVLFGDVNPAGRLPIGLLKSAGAAPAPYWRTLGTDVYVDGSSTALFPFGHGLSYTSFEYGDLELEADAVPTDGTVRLAFTVTNTGSRSGDEVVQVYGQDVAGRTVRPARTLVAFRRVTLDAGEKARVVVEVPASMFALWDATDGWVVEPGRTRFHIGASSTDIRLKGQIELVGEDHLPGRSRALVGSVTLVEVAAGATFAPVAAPTAPTQATARPLTAVSTVGEWFEHPVGGPLLREALGGADEEALAPAFGLTLDQMITYSQGALPATLLKDLLANPRLGDGSDTEGTS
ncbi:beta-glucosidase family protein [Brachybacterium massiliense]|uniref:beta-glucosidase family protein n=1 Tax=Brachybacterium massiliense TaxID=1755098 RepID=UPI000B3BC32A|nr:glycoside hydrolase family 3 N-terminal domain-containing protein [Brachybacterium massiliense]